MIQAEYLTKPMIETKAFQLRNEFKTFVKNVEHKYWHSKIPLEMVLDFLVATNKLSGYHFTINYGLDEYNLGRLEFHNKIIVIYDGLKSKGRENFTIAHEIGHLILHYPLWVSLYEHRDIKPQFNFVCNREMINGKRQVNTNDDILEWQANYFACCYLMPSLVIHRKYKRFERRIARSYASTVSNDLIGYIASECMVSRLAAEIRLREMGLLNLEYIRPEEKKRILEYKSEHSTIR